MQKENPNFANKYPPQKGSKFCTDERNTGQKFRHHFDPRTIFSIKQPQNTRNPCVVRTILGPGKP
jgi:hypothetical protein